MIRAWICAIVLAAVVIAPTPAPAQCGMGGMMESGHRHEMKGTKRTTKHDKTIQKLLSDQGARTRLFEMIADDDALFQEFLSLGFETTRGRTLGAELLKQARLDAVADDGAGSPPSESAPAVAVYQCPMHPEVRSSSAGACPKCGMTLERIEDPSAP